MGFTLVPSNATKIKRFCSFEHLKRYVDMPMNKRKTWEIRQRAKNKKLIPNRRFRKLACVKNKAL